MALSSELYGTARITIFPGKLKEFKQLVAECVKVVQAKDTGTLEYDFFINAEGTECFVHERYRDSAAGLEHMKNISDMMDSLSKVCSMTGEICGRPNSELRRALESAGVIIYSPLLNTE